MKVAFLQTGKMLDNGLINFRQVAEQISHVKINFNFKFRVCSEQQVTRVVIITIMSTGHVRRVIF